MTPRKIWLLCETILAEAGAPAPRPVTRAVIALVITNPLVAEPSASLELLIDLGLDLAQRYYPRAISLLPQPAVAYGKSAIVGGVCGQPD